MTTAWDAALAWFRAQLDEDERVAEANILRINGGKGEWTVDGMQVRDDRGHLIVRHTWPNEAEHIVRHDPAAVLRRVDADRLLLDWNAWFGGPDARDAYEFAVRVRAQEFAGLPDFPEVLRLDPAHS